MSATGRGAERAPSDYYPTPAWAIRLLLQSRIIHPPFLDPCAGNGAFGKEIRTFYPDSEIHQIEIRPEEADSLSAYGNVQIDDFLKASLPHSNYKTVITNPPYSLATQMISRAHEVCPQAEIIMLLRLNFLGSLKRVPFFENYPVTGIHVIAPRPSFSPAGGTDATEYAYLVWRGQKTQIRPLIWRGKNEPNGTSLKFDVPFHNP